MPLLDSLFRKESVLTSRHNALKTYHLSYMQCAKRTRVNMVVTKTPPKPDIVLFPSNVVLINIVLNFYSFQKRGVKRWDVLVWVLEQPDGE